MSVALPAGASWHIWKDGKRANVAAWARWRVDGGFVTHFGGVTGQWERSKHKADLAAVVCWRHAQRRAPKPRRGGKRA